MACILLSSLLVYDNVINSNKMHLLVIFCCFVKCSKRNHIIHALKVSVDATTSQLLDFLKILLVGHC